MRNFIPVILSNVKNMFFFKNPYTQVYLGTHTILINSSQIFHHTVVNICCQLVLKMVLDICIAHFHAILFSPYKLCKIVMAPFY